MKKQVFLFLVLAVLVAGGVFAQRTRRLSEAEVQGVFDRVNKKKVNQQNVKDALDVLQCYTEWKKVGKFSPQFNPTRSAQRGLMDILDTNDLDWKSAVPNLISLYGFYLDYIKNVKDSDSIKKAQTLAFDVGFWVVGFAPGAPYYKAVIASAEKAVNLIHARNAYNLRFIELYEAGDTLNKLQLSNARWRKVPTSFDESGMYMPIQGILDLDPSRDKYYELVKGWFCAVWEPSLKVYDEFCIFQDIAHYVLALQILEKAGVL